MSLTNDSIVAVDLGTNSFRLQIMTVEGDAMHLKESLKETVQLGAGLDAGGMLDEPSQQRALETLSRFADRIRGAPTNVVRVVGTNTLRVAKNVGAFIQKAERTLGYPIDVISGFEEARLIFQGAANALPSPDAMRFVVDIGGGSTEIMIGVAGDLQLSASLHMGCVSFSRRFFPDGKITKSAFAEAELAARLELQPIVESFNRHGWTEAVGCSGTIRALCELSRQSHHTDLLGVCVMPALIELKARLIKAGSVAKSSLEGVNDERAAVLPGGLAILLTVFDAFSIDSMTYSDGALLLGLFYDQIGRIHHEDLRDKTVNDMMSRYRVDRRQADRVARLALAFFDGLAALIGASESEQRYCRQMLAWACALHEVGKSISISGYRRHSAYILRNADMPGFSKQNQAYLALLVFAQRGKIINVIRQDGQDILDKTLSTADLAVICCLRLSVLCHRARRDMTIDWRWESRPTGYYLNIPDVWLKDNPLAESTLVDELAQWRSLPLPLFLTRC